MGIWKHNCLRDQESIAGDEMTAAVAEKDWDEVADVTVCSPQELAVYGVWPDLVGASLHLNQIENYPYHIGEPMRILRY